MSPLDAARELLPSWVRLVPWLWGPALGLLGALTLALAARVPKVPEEPWWEKARVVFPLRQFLFSTRLLWLVLAIVAASTGTVASPSFGRWYLTLACAWLPPVVMSVRFEARLRALPMRTVLRSWAALAVAGYGHAYFLVAVWGVFRVGGAVGVAAGVVGFVVAVVLTSGGNLRVAEALGLARPADERTRTAVERVAARMQVRLRGVVELDWAMANALAYPLVRRVAFTRRAVEMLSDAELEAVAAHELGHVNEPLSLKVTRPLSMATALGLLFVLPWLTEQGFNATLLGLGAAVLVLLVALRARRRGEQHADAHAKDTDGTYAGVLEKLYRENLVPPVLRRGGAHGHLYDRLVAAGQPPSWPRPAPPGRVPLRTRLVVVAALVVVMYPVALYRFNPVRSADEARAAIALGDSSAWTLEVLARDAAHRSRWADAVTFYLAAEERLPSEPFFPSARAVALLNSGRCAEAAQAVASLAQLKDLDDGVRETVRVVEAALPACGAMPAP